MKPRLLCGLAATAVLTLGMGVAPAAADSILYLKDGNVWLTTPDGARQFQVTDRGGYHGASQADDGTIIAVNGERLHKLNRYGDIVADFATPVTDGAQSPGETGYDYFHGPFDPVITPDGGKVAYSYIWRHNAYDPVCDCVHFRGETGTAITHSDRLTAWSEFGGHLSGWQHPSWVDDDDLLRSEADIPLADNVVVNRIGPGLGDDQLTRWFREVGVNVANRKDAEVNRKQTKLALVGLKEHVGHPEENVDWHVRVYRAAGGFGAEPEACFRIFPDQPNTEPRSPSWSPEGDRLAWEETAGIKTLTVPDFPGACNIPADDTKLIVPGGTLPDWGPAGVPTARPGRPGGGSGADTGKPGGATTPGAALPVRVSRASLRRGFKVVVTAPGPGTIRATAAKRRKKVASGARRVKHAGRTTVRLRFTSRGRRSVRRAGRLRLSLKVSFAQPGQRVQRRTVKVTVTR
jgi:hypothetical protein